MFWQVARDETVQRTSERRRPAGNNNHWRTSLQMLRYLS